MSSEKDFNEMTNDEKLAASFRLAVEGRRRQADTEKRRGRSATDASDLTARN